MGRVISDELFHFVGSKSPSDDERNFDTLANILESRCITYDRAVLTWGPETITIDWTKSLLDGELVVPNMTCFCDIPHEHLDHTHVPKYGRFGLSLNKTHLIRYGTRPVTYIPLHDGDIFGTSGSTLVREIELLFRGFYDHLEDKFGSANLGRNIGKPITNAAEAIAGLSTILTRDFLAFVKVYDSSLPETDPKYYYAEREWRRCGATKFEMNHVVSVVVAPNFVQRAQKTWPTLRILPTPEM